MSKNERKRIQEHLRSLSDLQRRLKPIATNLPADVMFSDADKQSIDSLLRSICGLFAERPQMLPLIAKFYGFVRLKRIQDRYRAIAAAHGIHIP